MEKIVRMGIVGTGMIVDWIMGDVAKARSVRVTAIASRSLERARAAAARYGIETAYGSYEEMAQSDLVDLVYIATPNNRHFDDAMLMMAHGKAVLCEKPMPLYEDECRRMIDFAREKNVFLMEGLWTRFFPAVARVRELLEAGTIGEVRHVESAFLCNTNYDDSKKDHRLFSMKLGGGSLLDLGIYCLGATTMALGANVKALQSLVMPAPTGADMRASVQMQYDNGATAHFTCGFDLSGRATEFIYGSKGSIEMDNFLSPTALTLRLDDGERREYRFPAENRGHWHQFEHVAQCLMSGKTESPLMPLSESLLMSRLMTRLRHDWGMIYPEEMRGGDAQ